MGFSRNILHTTAVGIFRGLWIVDFNSILNLHFSNIIYNRGTFEDTAVLGEVLGEKQDFRSISMFDSLIPKQQFLSKWNDAFRTEITISSTAQYYKLIF